MSTPAAGRSLELYYIDGRPDGMLTAEMFNWTGHVLMTPRTQLLTALDRTEASFTGVYLLLGEQDDQPLAYIGESENIGDRLRSHVAKKDWWTSAVLICTAGDKLNKAHVKYLEARLIQDALRIGRMPLDNTAEPGLPSLSEADVSKMEGFLEHLLIVLPALRIDMFVENTRPAATMAAPAVAAAFSTETSVRFVLDAGKHGLKATALLQNGEFVVEAGSQARRKWEGKNIGGYAKLHEELERSGVLLPEGDHCVFTQNYAFTAPSAAAAVVYGRQAQGTVAWKTDAGITYRDWEAQQLTKPQAVAA